MLRGLAAIAVVCFHLRGTFFVDRVPGTGMMLRLFYFATSLGDQAVMVFFVLSGFLIGANVLRSVQGHRWDWGSYLVNRFTRLYIVLVPALILGVLWDASGIGLTGTGGIYGGLLPNASISQAVLPSLRLPVFLGNLFFLQTIAVPNLGSNGPLWSLSNEFWYYIMFPMGVLALRPNSSVSRRWLYLLGFSGIAVFVGYSIARLITVWLLGVGVNFLPRFERLDVRPLCWIAFGFFCFAMVVSSKRPWLLHRALPNELWVGFASAILIYVLLQSGKPSSNGLYARIAVLLAGFSYTLYLVHLPLLVFIKALLMPHNRWLVDGWSLLAGLLILAVLLGYAWTIARFTEARTTELRGRLMVLCTRAGLVKAEATS